jgi:hypothetical protein
MWSLRLCGLVVALGAAGWLLFLGYALYSRTDYGLNVLVDLGMPVALLGTLIAGVSVGFGLWLAGHATDHRPPARR